MTKSLDTRDVIQLLDYIVYEKAGVFILEQKLDLLYSWISGYKIASEVSSSEFKNLEQINDFSQFVHEKNNEEFENTFGWFGSIRAKHGGNQEGFENFCKLYREFRELKK